MSIAEPTCPECRGFGYTKGSERGPWDKLDCENCGGKGRLPIAEALPEPIEEGGAEQFHAQMDQLAAAPEVRIMINEMGVQFEVGVQRFTLSNPLIREDDPDEWNRHNAFIAAQLRIALSQITEVQP